MILNYQINQIANREFGRVNSPPTNYYIGLLTAIPNADGTNVVEVPTLGTGYSRQLLPNNKTALTTANNGQVTNISEIQFPTATASWGIVVDVGIFDSANNGNLLYDSPQITPKAYDVGDVAFFAVGDIKWTVQNITD